MKKYIFILGLFILISSIGVSAQEGVGINTNEPEATFDIYPIGEDTDGILFPTVNDFSSTDPGDDQNSMLVFLNRTAGSAGFEGLYFWDTNEDLWQYIFQSKMLGMNLFKTIVETDNSTTISSGPTNTNVWFKTNFNAIEAPSANYELDNGDLIIGKTGNYSVFFTGEMSKAIGDTGGTSTQVGIFLDGVATPDLISTISIPAADNNNRTVNHSISSIIYLTKGQRVSLQARRTAGAITLISVDNFSLTLSYLD